ncbi:unnamed protein product [Rotaria sordida]|uniref:Uncharacterized protein n=1 Tax=Rotaria sordida TaxID=392033 RepID=A0A815DVB2_9BILA|nr:unnamed protein product [Rotaria sordida]CAF4060331.1 unnamed protein product [Rotaria sordida]
MYVSEHPVHITRKAIAKFLVSPPAPGAVDPPMPKPDILSRKPYEPTEFHIIIDNSNVFIGSQNIHNEETGLTQINPAIRVNVKKLAKVLEANKLRIDIKTRFVGGSIPPKNARAWEEWKVCGYKCTLGERSASGSVSCILDNDHIKTTFPVF